MLRIAGTIPESIVDGPGFRFALFTQGCPHHCPGCHNPQTHNPEGGRQVSLLALMRQIWQSRAHIDGVTFSGGDPFCQPLPLYHLARWCHRLGLDVMAYSGWTLEELRAKPECRNLLNEIDILVENGTKTTLRPASEMSEVKRGPLVDIASLAICTMMVCPT